MPEEPKRNCPFYGRAFFFTNIGPSLSFMLLNSQGNQCGVLNNVHAPCKMEIERHEVEWSECEVLKQVRI